MSDTLRYPSVPPKTLANDLSSTGTLIQLTECNDWAGNALTTADFNTSYIPATLINDSRTLAEFVLIDASTIANATTTGLLIYRRGLKYYAEGDSTDADEVTANKLAWTQGETKLLLGSNPPYMYGQFPSRGNDETITGLWEFPSGANNPTIGSSYLAPTLDNQIATKKYIDDIAIAGTPDASTTVKGSVEIATGAELAAGTGTGGTGAILVPAGDSFTNTPAGAGDENKVAVLNSAGQFDEGFINVGALTPTGMITQFAGRTAPTGWLLCDGSAVSRATYADLFGVLSPTVGTFTITVAAPAVVTLTAHGLATGDSIYLTTTGALPTGLAVNTRYWVVKVDANTFNLSTTLANALAGTKITTTGTQSGVHTAMGCAYGLGDGSTTFNVPSFKGIVPVGFDQSQTEFAGLGQTGGEKTHTLTTAEMPSHTHTMGSARNGGSGGSATDYPKQSDNGGTTPALSGLTGSQGSDGAHNNIQPYVTVSFIIKT